MTLFYKCVEIIQTKKSEIEKFWHLGCCRFSDWILGPLLMSEDWGGLGRLTGSHGRLILVDQSKTDNCRLNLLWGLSPWPLASLLSWHREKIKFVLTLHHWHCTGSSEGKNWKLETKIRIFSVASHGIIYISDNFPITILKNQIVIYFISGDKNSRV